MTGTRSSLPLRCPRVASGTHLVIFLRPAERIVETGTSGNVIHLQRLGKESSWKLSLSLFLRFGEDIWHALARVSGNIADGGPSV